MGTCEGTSRGTCETTYVETSPPLKSSLGQSDTVRAICLGRAALKSSLGQSDTLRAICLGRAAFLQDTMTVVLASFVWVFMPCSTHAR